LTILAIDRARRDSVDAPPFNGRSGVGLKYIHRRTMQGTVGPIAVCTDAARSDADPTIVIEIHDYNTGVRPCVVRPRSIGDTHDQPALRAPHLKAEVVRALAGATLLVMMSISPAAWRPPIGKTGRHGAKSRWPVQGAPIKGHGSRLQSLSAYMAPLRTL